MACIGHLWRHVLKGPLKAKLGSLSDLCMEEYIGHEHFNGLEVNWLFLIVMDDLKTESNNFKAQNSQLQS